MLTVANINAEKGKDYYLKGYYLEETSRWWGKGAEKLKLNGAVDEGEVFQNILKGYSTSGRKKLGGKKIDVSKRRAAVDCTFNAPKSVSLQALVGGDERLLDAHKLAVEKTLKLMEERYAHTRVRKGNDRIVVNTGNLVVAQFDHIESRAVVPDDSGIETGPDPHLHTHCLVMNMTELKRGVWYSHLNEAIYSNKKYLGMVYQHHLALEVQKLGYEIEATGHGQFDIKGFKVEDLTEFSKRRQKILEKAVNPASTKDRNAAWDATRQRKKVIVPAKLRQRWREEAAALGIEFVIPNENVKRTDIKQKTVTQSHVTEAISHCSERDIAFHQEGLEKFILEEGLPVAIADLEDTIKQHPELIKLAQRNGTRYTTQAALLRELATIRMMQQRQGQVAQILSTSQTQEILADLSLTDGQREAISTALTSTDGIMAWQGVAGAGKTYALNHFTSLAKINGYSVKGFAPSAEAAKVLSSEIRIEGNTVASLLHSKPNSTPEPNQIWIVDEAGLLSADAAYKLLKRAEEEQARVLFVGDTRQLSAVEAGNPFKSLQQAGMTTAFMDQSLRQKAPHLQEAVDLIAKGEIHSGFELLDTENCIEEVDKKDKLNRIVADYLAVSPEQRERTLVLAGTNRERLDITQGIREGLRREGRLGESVSTTQLKQKDLTKVQMKYAHNFEIGDIIVPLKSYKKRQLDKGKRYLIVAKQDDHLVLKNEQGDTTTVDLRFEKAAYSQSQMDIATGELLKWTKNDKKLGRRNGQQFRVTAIKDHIATIAYHDGQTEQINLNEAQHFDYGLVSTTYSAQGKTADKVLISADFTVGKESFYVAVSRVKHDLKLYTSSKRDLLEKALTSRAKENPLESIRASFRAEHQDLVDDSIPESEKVAQPQSKEVRITTASLTSLKSPNLTPPTVTAPKSVNSPISIVTQSVQPTFSQSKASEPPAKVTNPKPSFESFPEDLPDTVKDIIADHPIPNHPTPNPKTIEFSATNESTPPTPTFEQRQLQLLTLAKQYRERVAKQEARDKSKRLSKELKPFNFDLE